VTFWPRDQALETHFSEMQSMIVMVAMYAMPELSSCFSAMRVMQLNKFLCNKCVGLAEKAPATDEIARLRGTLAWSYLSYHNTLDMAGLWLTDDEAFAFDRQTNLFNMTLMKLVDVDRPHLWRARPKHHGLDHLAITLMNVSKLNPKKTSCLLEEDFLGKLKRIGITCRGSNCVSQTSRFFDRYLLELSLRWHKRRQCDHWLGN